MRLLLIFLVLTSLISVAEPPKFESFPATLHPIKTYAPTHATKSGIDWKMQRYLRYSDSEPLNFADKYTLSPIGCGTGCVEYCLIDRTTGTVHPGPDFNQDFPPGYIGPIGLQFRRDSNLLIVYHATAFAYPVHVNYYALKGTNMTLLESNEIRTSPVSEQSNQAAYLAVWHEMFTHWKGHQYHFPEKFFLSISDNDAPTNLLAQFRQEGHDVAPGSQYQHGRGILCSVQAVEYISASEAKVWGGYQFGREGGEWGYFNLKLDRGKWKVVSWKPQVFS